MEQFLEEVKDCKDIRAGLADLKESVDIAQETYFSKVEKLYLRDLKDQRNEIKLEQLEKIQNKIVKIKTSDDNTLCISKENLFNSPFLNILQDMVNNDNYGEEILLELPKTIALGFLDIIRYHNKDKVNIFLDDNEEDSFKTNLSLFFKNKNDVGKITKKVKIILKTSCDDFLDSDIAFDPSKKSNFIFLSNKNRTAKMTNNVHATVLGNQVYSSGKVAWRIKIDNRGDTDWICIGISSNPTLWGDIQLHEATINLRGGPNDCNKMAPSRHPPLNHGDIFKCTLDFEADMFTIERVNGQPFFLTSTVPIRHKSWYIYVQMYYLSHQVTLLSDDD